MSILLFSLCLAFYYFNRSIIFLVYLSSLDISYYLWSVRIMFVSAHHSKFQRRKRVMKSPPNELISSLFRLSEEIFFCWDESCRFLGSMSIFCSFFPKESICSDIWLSSSSGCYLLFINFLLFFGRGVSQSHCK